MPADVNVTEKMARAVAAESVWEAIRDALATRHDNPGLDALLRIDPDDPEGMAARVLVEARDAIATAALSALADPEVLAGIAGVLREHGVVTVRQGNTSRGGLIHNERVCEGCGHELPWHSWRDALADHAAAAVVEWLRGRAL